MVWKLSIYNQINYKDMKRVINGMVRKQILARRMTTLGWWRGQCGALIPKVNLYRRSMAYWDSVYFRRENADEDPEIRVSVTDEGLIGKKMRETMLAKGKPIVLEKVRLYVQSMAKGDLLVKREKLKSNQLAPLVAAMQTAPAASKSSVVVRKSNRGFKSHWKEWIWVVKPKGLWYHENVSLIHHS